MSAQTFHSRRVKNAKTHLLQTIKTPSRPRTQTAGTPETAGPAPRIAVLRRILHIRVPQPHHDRNSKTASPEVPWRKLRRRALWAVSRVLFSD